MVPLPRNRGCSELKSSMVPWSRVGDCSKSKCLAEVSFLEYCKKHFAQLKMAWWVGSNAWFVRCCNKHLFFTMQGIPAAGSTELSMEGFGV